MEMKRNISRWLSLVLVFTLIIGLVQLPFPERVKASGRSTSLEMDYVNQIIHCSVTLENENNYDYAYFVGDFNGWNSSGKQEKYKLVWQGEGADRKLKLSLPMNADNIQNGFGEKQYKYMLHKRGIEGDADSNFDWVTSTGYDGENASFNWQDIKIEALNCNPDLDANEVVFTVKSRGFDKVSVHGEFGNNKGWETHELTHKDGMDSDTKTLAFPMEKRATGDYQYLFKLEKTGIETIWINGNFNSDSNSSFSWTTAYEIKKLSHQVLVDQKKVRFEAEARGYEQVRVGYRKQGESNWENIPMIKDNTEDIFTLDLPMDGKPNGTYEFKFSLLPKGGNSSDNGSWEWYKEGVIKGDGNSTFEWNPIVTPSETEADFQIKSSSKFVSAKDPVELLAVKVDEKKNIETFENITWKIEPEVTGASVSDGVLTVADTVAENTTINLKAYKDGETSKVAKKEITVKATGENSDKVLVHFLKQDGNYEGWNCWVYPLNPDQRMDFTNDSDMGKTAYLPKGKKVIVRRSEGSAEWLDQTKEYALPESGDVYIIKDDNHLYTSFKEAFLASGPRIRAAIMDGESEIQAYLTEAAIDGIQFELYKNDAKVDGISTSFDSSKMKVTLSNIPDFDPTALYEVKADHMFRQPAEVTKRLVLNEYKFDGDMGVKYEGDNVNFCIWAPTAHKVELLTYGNVAESETSPTGTHALTHDATSGTYFATINKTYVDNKYYLYKLTFKTRLTNGNFGERVTYAVDPYAIATGLNGKKGYITDIDNASLKPDNWDTDQRPKLEKSEDSIIYEMHVRDFTISPNWGGDRAKAGKFLGVAEEGTTYSKDGKTVSTGLDHLVELGVTHVHLLPVYDIASIDEEGPYGFNAKKEGSEAFNRNWGYDPQNYNALEGSYSTNPEDPTLVIKEFRTMVQKLHESGIRVVLDKVYNHMYSTENMDKIVPGYYFRSFEDGKLSNGSSCGNEVASERPMVRKFIVDSNKMWLKNYKVDGLRFDLMALLDKTTMDQVQSEAKKIDPSIIVYGEPWKADSSPLAEHDQTKKGNTGIAAFNDDFRNALRGDNNPSKGFIQGEISSENAGKVHEGLRGSVNGTVGDPELIINYVEAHDNYAIWDQVEKSDLGTKDGQFRKSIPENPLSDWRVNKTLLASGFVLTAQGIPFFQGGSEFLRTKQGDHNSYISSDTTNAIHWEDKVTYQKVFDFYKDLIQIRKEHPAFRMATKGDIQGNQEVSQFMYKDSLIFNHMKNNAGGDKWKNIVVIYNGSTASIDVDWLPMVEGKKWKVLFDKNGLQKENQKVVTQKENGLLTEKLPFPASSLMILYDEEGKADNIQWDYLFADQSADYMSPLEPTATEPVKVRFRAAAGEVTEAKVHYYNEADSAEHTLSMTKMTDDNFYMERGFDKTKVEFWEGEIPASGSRKYYQFEVINGTKKAYISGGTGENNRGVTNSKPNNKGFWIVPEYKTPDWTKEAVFYQIMVDRFRDGDSSNNRVAKDVSQFGKPSEISAWGSPVYKGTESDKTWNNQFFGGDLIGVKEALPYFKYLGVDSLYLMPIFQSGSDHKYDADDYEFVDKNFGGNVSLASLSKAMKDEQMKLVLDGVFNHTSTEGDLFKNHKADYYFYEKGAYRDKATPQNQIDFYPWHGYTNLAKLNYSEQDVKDYIYNGENAIAKRYLRDPYNIDGWRLDAAEDVNTEPRDYKSDPLIDIKTTQTNEQQKAENLKIWQEFRKAVKGEKPEAFILGEFWGNDNQWYKERAWDSKMNYGGFMMPFLENNSGNSYLGRQSLDNKGDKSVADLGKYTRNYFTMFPYQTILTATNSISTHDKERFLNREFAGEGNKQMMQLAVALQMTYPGVPMIYYGDEIGTRGREDGKDPYNRGTFNWDINSWNDASKQMFKDHKTLIETRKKNKDAFVYGAFEEIASHNDAKYIAYARYGKGNRSITILNNNGGAGSQSIKLEKLERYGFKNGEKLYDVLSDKEVTISGGEATFPSKNMSASVWVLEGKKPTVTNDIQFTLEEASDSRSKLPSVNNAKLSVSGDEITVEWDAYQETGAKEISVGIYDGDKRVAEKTVLSNAKAVSFEKTDKIPANFTAEIKVLADRTKSPSGAVTDDGYADSDFVSLLFKKVKPNDSNDSVSENIVPVPSTDGKTSEEKSKEEAEKTEEKKDKEVKEDQGDKKEPKKKEETKTELKNESAHPTFISEIINSPLEEVIFVEKENKTAASIPSEILSKVLSGEASELVIEVKDALIALGRAPLERLIGKDATNLQVEVKSLSSKNKVVKKDLKKVGKNELLKKKVFTVSFKRDGKKLTKVDLGKSKFTISLQASLKKVTKTVYVMDLTTKKLIKARYNKKDKIVVFKTNKPSKYVIVKKAVKKKVVKVKKK